MRFFFLGRLLPRQRSGPRFFFQARQIKRFTVLAAVDFNVRSELLFHFVPKEIPALQMPGAQLALVVFLVAGSTQI